ncbi:hypothetical protein HDU92_009171, partial [Lobulomyces angularis]
MATPNQIPSQDFNFFDYNTYLKTSEYLKNKLPTNLQSVEVGIICGSGLGGLAQTLTNQVEFKYEDIPNFAVSTVQGHAGKLVFGLLSGKVAVCMVGRFHLYEGHALLRTVFPVRIMKLLGCHTLLVTNAAGGLNPKFNVGDIMVIEDHLSMTGFGGQNALIGPNIPEFGTRFPPVSDAYDENLRVVVFKAAKEVGISYDIMREGVYTFVAGPSFESRAEARFLRLSGADAVGMSTVPEVIVARHCGMRVLGLSLITNRVGQGFGQNSREIAENKIEESIADIKLDSTLIASHAEVLETSLIRSEAMQGLVKKIIEL